MNGKNLKVTTGRIGWGGGWGRRKEEENQPCRVYEVTRKTSQNG